MIFFSSDRNIPNDEQLIEIWNKLGELVIDMTKTSYRKRPSCAQIVKAFESLSIVKEKLEDKYDLTGKKFFLNILKDKWK